MREKTRPETYDILSVVTGCGGGDWHPLLALSTGLRRSGHRLMVICDTSTADAVADAELTPLSLPPSLDLANIFEPAMARLLSGEEKPAAVDESPLTEWGHSCVDFIRQSLKGWRPSLVITTLFGLGLGEILSKGFSAPRCFLNPSFYFGDLHQYIRSRDFSDAGGEMYRCWLLPPANRADFVLHATDRIFDIVPDDLASHHTYVGPMFWEMAGSGLDLLDKPGPPWVLITLSTSPQPGDTDIVRTALKPLGSMNVRVLVTLAPGHDKGALGRIPDNVFVAGYVPHSKVLPHCRLVISHAGHGIVMKAMTHGVPMVLVPWGRDQPGVAVRAQRLGTARVVPRERCNVDVLAAAIGETLNDPEYLERSQRVSRRLGRIDGVTDAVLLVEDFLDKRFKIQ